MGFRESLSDESKHRTDGLNRSMGDDKEYLGEEPLPRSVESVARLYEMEKGLRFLTNDPRPTRPTVFRNLEVCIPPDRQLGVPTSEQFPFRDGDDASTDVHFDVAVGSARSEIELRGTAHLVPLLDGEFELVSLRVVVLDEIPGEAAVR